jgi:hypothetical protein
MAKNKKLKSVKEDLKLAEEKLKEQEELVRSVLKNEKKVIKEKTEPTLKELIKNATGKKAIPTLEQYKLIKEVAIMTLTGLKFNDKESVENALMLMTVYIDSKINNIK